MNAHRSSRTAKLYAHRSFHRSAVNACHLHAADQRWLLSFLRLKVPTTKTELIVQELHLLWSPGDVEFPQAHWLTLTNESGVDSH